MEEWENLPKFLLLENYDDDWVGVMHCHFPRFIMEFADDEDDIEEAGEVAVWIDDPDDLDAKERDDILAAACDFFVAGMSDDDDEEY